MQQKFLIQEPKKNKIQETTFYDAIDAYGYLLAEARIGRVYLMGIYDEHFVSMNIAAATLFVKAILEGYPKPIYPVRIAFQQYKTLQEAIEVLTLIKQDEPFFKEEH